MSISVMGTCWKYSKARGTDLLVLLALADIANENGECWPSIPHLARKCRLDERTAQRRIRSLERLGELVVVICGGKSSRPGGLRSNHYRIVVYIPTDKDSDGDDSPPRQSATGGTQATNTPAPVSPMTPAPVPPEPSVRTIIESPSALPVSMSALPARSDALFDAVAEVCGIDPRELTPGARGAMNRAIKDLRSVDADADEIRARAATYRRIYPRTTLTPPALARHWASLRNGNSSSPVDRAFALARGAGR